MKPTPARASAAAHSLLRRTRCFAAANRMRPNARASPARRRGRLGRMYLFSLRECLLMDGSEKVDGVKAGDDELDVAIVGGGMVGLAVACALSNMPLTKHLRVAIIDSNPALKSRGYVRKDGIPDSRVSTVTPATISFFRDIGAWEHIQQQRHTFFGKMQEQKEDIEKMIYPTRLVSLAFPSKSRQGAAGVKSPSTEAGSTSHTSEEFRSNLVKLDLSDGQTLYSKLAVGADGCKSNIMTVHGRGFSLSGPIALLPIGNNFSNIVWTMSPEEALHHKSTSTEDFLKAVNHALDFGYGPHPNSSSIDHYMERLFSGIGDTAASTKECFEVPPKAIGLISERMAFPLSLMHP